MVRFGMFTFCSAASRQGSGFLAQGRSRSAGKWFLKTMYNGWRSWCGVRLPFLLCMGLRSEVRVGQWHKGTHCPWPVQEAHGSRGLLGVSHLGTILWGGLESWWCFAVPDWHGHSRCWGNIPLKHIPLFCGQVGPGCLEWIHLYLLRSSCAFASVRSWICFCFLLSICLLHIVT